LHGLLGCCRTTLSLRLGRAALPAVDLAEQVTGLVRPQAQVGAAQTLSYSPKFWQSRHTKSVPEIVP
jgi:hypothetical protein